MGYRRPLITPNIGDPGLQQCLRHGKDAFPMKNLSLTEPQKLDFLLKGSLHRYNESWI